jgi:tight adherence protein B
MGTDPSLVTLLIFLVTLALVVCGIYFFVEIPSARKRLRQRFESAKKEMTYAGSGPSPEAELLRAEILSHLPFLNKLLKRIPGTTRLNFFVQQSEVDVTAGMLITLSLLAGWFVFLVCFLLSLPVLIAIVFAFSIGAIPWMVIAVKRQRRFLKFEELFPDAMDLLARAVRAGHAFTTGLELIAKEMSSPLSTEFQKTYEQQNLGLPLRDALQNLAVRMPLADVRIFVTALTIQRETGGNLAEILDNLSHVIRERFKLVRQVKVFTAQGRLSLYVLVAVPPIMGTVMYVMNPSYTSLLFTDPMGVRMLVAAIVLQLIGYFVIRKIIQPKY